jgi:hypothetical protein
LKYGNSAELEKKLETEMGLNEELTGKERLAEEEYRGGNRRGSFQ